MKTIVCGIDAASLIGQAAAAVAPEFAALSAAASGGAGGISGEHEADELGLLSDSERLVVAFLEADGRPGLAAQTPATEPA